MRRRERSAGRHALQEHFQFPLIRRPKPVHKLRRAISAPPARGFWLTSPSPGIVADCRLVPSSRTGCLPPSPAPRPAPPSRPASRLIVVWSPPFKRACSSSVQHVQPSVRPSVLPSALHSTNHAYLPCSLPNSLPNSATRALSGSVQVLMRACSGSDEHVFRACRGATRSIARLVFDCASRFIERRARAPPSLRRRVVLSSSRCVVLAA